MRPYTILLCGDRNWTDEKLIRTVLNDWLRPKHDTVIHGDARGADKLGAWVARQSGVPPNRIIAYRADWKKYGKAAGPIRNQRMLKEGNPDLVLAFHHDIEHSKGTKHMIDIARKAGVSVCLNGKELKWTQILMPL